MFLTLHFSYINLGFLSHACAAGTQNCVLTLKSREDGAVISGIRPVTMKKASYLKKQTHTNFKC